MSEQTKQYVVWHKEPDGWKPSQPMDIEDAQQLVDKLVAENVGFRMMQKHEVTLADVVEG